MAMKPLQVEENVFGYSKKHALGNVSKMLALKYHYIRYSKDRNMKIGARRQPRSPIACNKVV